MSRNTISNPEYITSLDYRSVNPWKLNSEELGELNGLLARSVRADFGDDMTLADGFEFAEHTQMDTLARYGYQPGGQPDTLQKYINQRIIIASEAGLPVATWTVADNASAGLERGRLAAQAEIEAKLHVPVKQFIDAKWHWLGMRAVSPLLVPPVKEVTDQPPIDIVDVLLYASMAHKRASRPVSIWLWDRERWLEDTVVMAGLQQADRPRPKSVHTEAGQLPVREQHMTAEGIGSVRRNIRNKQNGAKVLDLVMPRVKWA